MDQDANESSPVDEIAALVAALPIGHQVRTLQRVLRLVIEALADPDGLRHLDPAMPEAAAPDWGGIWASEHVDERQEEQEQSSEHGGVSDGEGTTGDSSLPVVMDHVEELHRSVCFLQAALAGHADHVFGDPREREQVLGIPPGKCAFRDTASYLEQRLGIAPRDARQRVRRATYLLSRPARLGEAADAHGHTPITVPLLAVTARDGAADPETWDLVEKALTGVRAQAEAAGVEPSVVDEQITEGDAFLSAQARDLGPRQMRHLCQRWEQWAEAVLFPDGLRPEDAEPETAAGLLYVGRRRGLHRWQLSVGQSHHELLQTIIGAATNPRASRNEETSPSASDGTTTDHAPAENGSSAHDAPKDDAEETVATDHTWSPVTDGTLDPRSPARRQLDGVIAALQGALTMLEGNGLPASGGVRPQMLVTIDHQTLLNQLRRDGEAAPVSEAAHTGPIGPETLRVMACDAEITPIVLGGAGQVLDLGRAQRLFPARLRKAITARDGGCAAPGCPIPAPWTEVHHIDHWEHGGPTSVANGCLLCNHHHGAVHAGAWEIQVRQGVPWFIPAHYLDPDRRPRRNRYWR